MIPHQWCERLRYAGQNPRYECTEQKQQKDWETRAKTIRKTRRDSHHNSTNSFALLCFLPTKPYSCFIPFKCRPLLEALAPTPHLHQFLSLLLCKTDPCTSFSTVVLWYWTPSASYYTWGVCLSSLQLWALGGRDHFLINCGPLRKWINYFLTW